MASTTTMPNYPTPFAFEWQFDHNRAVNWMQEHCHTSFYYAGAYLAIIYYCQAWMKGRPRYELKSTLVVWNFVLAVFSVLGAFRMIPEQVYMLRQPGGFHNSVCTPIHDHNSVWGFWAFAFILSKAPELGDTVFIVLRKQPLIFLHWYHHVTVLIFSWYTHAEYAAPSRWYIVMNYTIHSFMYSYFALRALNVRLPKPISIFITSSQLLQMIVGVIVNLYAGKAKLDGLSCDVSYTNISFALLMYTSYFVLFARFFYRAYVSKVGHVRVDKVADKDK